MRVLRSMSTSFASALGYVLLLTAFVALGLFAAVLATGNGVAAAVMGIGLIASLTGSVMCFRAASRRLAQSELFAEATSPLSIFSTPIHRDQVERYLAHYRRENRSVDATRTLPLVVSGESSRRTQAQQAEPVLLSA